MAGFFKKIVMYNLSQLDLSDPKDEPIKRLYLDHKVQEDKKNVVNAKMESIKVRKNGKEVEIEVSQKANLGKAMKINSLLKKDMKDLFRELQFGDTNKKDKRSVIPDVSFKSNKKIIKEKMQRNSKNEILLKYKMIISARAVRGLLYLEALKRKIQLVKELFVYEVE